MNESMILLSLVVPKNQMQPTLSSLTIKAKRYRQYNRNEAGSLYIAVKIGGKGDLPTKCENHTALYAVSDCLLITPTSFLRSEGGAK